MRPPWQTRRARWLTLGLSTRGGSHLGMRSKRGQRFLRAVTELCAALSSAVPGRTTGRLVVSDGRRSRAGRKSQRAKATLGRRREIAGRYAGSDAKLRAQRQMFSSSSSSKGDGDGGRSAPVGVKRPSAVPASLLAEALCLQCTPVPCPPAPCAPLPATPDSAAAGLAAGGSTGAKRGV